MLLKSRFMKSKSNGQGLSYTVDSNSHSAEVISPNR